MVDNVLDDLFPELRSFGRGSRLDREDGLEQQPSLVLVIGDLRVVVHSEGLRTGAQRQLVEVVEVVLDRPGRQREVSARFRVLVVVAQSVFVDVLLDYRLDQSDVFVISHAAPVVDLPAKELDDFIRDVIVVVEQHLQLPLADRKVLVGKLIGDVPANRAELSPVLDYSVEEAETEEQLLENLRFLAVVELYVAEVLIASEHVRAQPRGRLDGHLDAVLQHGDREIVGGHAGQPEAEVLVHVLVEVVDEPLEFGHPALS